jgi:hypothetical protein
MSKPSTEQPDFDEDFTKAVTEWRDKHRLREDDAVMLLVELFRIHQRHWDELRRREIPSFEQFRTDIAKLVGAAQTFQQQTAALLELLQSQPPDHGELYPLPGEQFSPLRRGSQNFGDR